MASAEDGNDGQALVVGGRLAQLVDGAATGAEFVTGFLGSKASTYFMRIGHFE